jgi:hypothetical protein
VFTGEGSKVEFGLLARVMTDELDPCTTDGGVVFLWRAG